MPSIARRRARKDSVITDSAIVPTLSEMIHEGLQSAARIKRATKEALLEWFAQSQRLNIARVHYKLKGARFIDFAKRIGVDRASAYQLVKLWQHRTAILARCLDEGRYYGWETCLYWFEKAPRSHWNRNPEGDQNFSEYTTPPTVFRQFGAACTLDVCAPAGKAMCAQYFTKGQDGLAQKWHGTVWLNPPYANLRPWCAKAYEYAKSGGTVIALLPAWTDTSWFHQFVSFGRITFIKGKLSYGGRSAYAPFASMIVEWSPPTLKRKRGAPLNAMLDTGRAMGGIYTAG